MGKKCVCLLRQSWRWRMRPLPPVAVSSRSATPRPRASRPARRHADRRAAHGRGARSEWRAAAGSSRSRPGIRFVQRGIPGVTTAGRRSPSSTGSRVPEWQWTHRTPTRVPSCVSTAASSITIAVIDTGADTSVRHTRREEPDHLQRRHRARPPCTTASATARSSRRSPPAPYADPTGMTGFGGNAHLMIVQANRGGANFTDIDEAGAIIWAVDNHANIINLSLGGSQTSDVERTQSTTRRRTTCSSSPRRGTRGSRATRRRIRQRCSARTGSSSAPRPQPARGAVLDDRRVRRSARSRRQCPGRARRRDPQQLLLADLDAGRNRQLRRRQRHVLRRARGGRRRGARLGREPVARRRGSRRDDRGDRLQPGALDARPRVRQPERRGRGRPRRRRAWRRRWPRLRCFPKPVTAKKAKPRAITKTPKAKPRRARR